MEKYKSLSFSFSVLGLCLFFSLTQSLPARAVRPRLDTELFNSNILGLRLSGGDDQFPDTYAEGPEFKTITYLKAESKGPNNSSNSGPQSDDRKNQNQWSQIVYPGYQPCPKRMFAQNTYEETQGYSEQDQGYSEQDNEYSEDYDEGNVNRPTDQGFLQEIQNHINFKSDSRQGLQDSTMPPEEKRPITERPYAGGAVSNLLGDKTELLITDIVMRHPNKMELIVHDELKPRDWVFDVKVQNVGKIPASDVEILVAVGNKRLKTSIKSTIEYGKSGTALVYMGVSQKLPYKRSVEVNAIVDPHDQYNEVNENNNLFTKRFILKKR